MRRACLLVALLGTAACASQGAATRPAPAAPPGQALAADGKPAQPQGGRTVCEYEKPIGSHIPERVCRWVPAVESQRAQTQDALRAMPRVQTQGGGK